MIDENIEITLDVEVMGTNIKKFRKAKGLSRRNLQTL